MRAISRMRGRPRRLRVVPQVLRMRRWVETKKDDSLWLLSEINDYDENVDYLSKYASISSPSIVLRTLH